ncbi:hypothetical protein J2TS6_42380 [Paenibacillus albilobatus]|uniref:Uncharacterized protein n=1 Tax=Paenibacillus albilobatus TaxID=2716884 RepID=A0A919XLX6_9BACL|nr:hypothetical protein J2TS6_42380 [Paenibacillus albilobatus]
MREGKTLRIVSEVVVDQSGNKIGEIPEEFPVITNKCKALIKGIETGQEYKVI